MPGGVGFISMEYEAGTGDLVWYDNAGTEIMRVDAATSAFVLAAGAALTLVADNVKFSLGTDGDIAAVLRASVLNANTALTGVIVGTPVTPAQAANSFILGNVTADGDMLFVTQTGGHSHAFMWYDTSAKILRLYSGDGVEVAKFDAAAVTITGTLTVTGRATLAHLGLGTPEDVTIVTGVATITKSHVNLAGEGATTDTLDSIVKTGQAIGDLLLIICSGAYTITFDNSSTLILGAGTRAMAAGSSMLLVATSATVWREVSFLTAAA